MLMQFVNQSKWFYKRVGNRKDKLKLGFNNLYIFPSKLGFYWILSCIYLFILGTNLSNNFAILISYFLLSLFFINLFLTHFSLHGLILKSIKQDVSFANQFVYYSIRISSKYDRGNIYLKFISNRNTAYITEKIKSGENFFKINLGKKIRGEYLPDHIYGYSNYPMSLFNCWFYWKPDKRFTVAPAKVRGEVRTYYERTKNKDIFDTNKFESIYNTNIKGIRKYIKGEKFSAIDWKKYSKCRKLYSREYENHKFNCLWIEPNKKIPLEKSLEHICEKIYMEYKNNNIYGLRLEKRVFLSPNKGKKHFEECLRLIANYRR